MTTVTITWRPVADGLPDAELNVLLWHDELGPFEGFHDGETFRDVTVLPVEGVTHWADKPEGPTA